MKRGFRVKLWDGDGVLSLIQCNSDCLYQQDGYCSLERAGASGEPAGCESCVNFVPLASKDRGQSLPDVSDPDKL